MLLRRWPVRWATTPSTWTPPAAGDPHRRRSGRAHPVQRLPQVGGLPPVGGAARLAHRDQPRAPSGSTTMVQYDYGEARPDVRQRVRRDRSTSAASHYEGPDSNVRIRAFDQRGRYWDRTSDLFGVNEALSR